MRAETLGPLSDRYNQLGVSCPQDEQDDGVRRSSVSGRSQRHSRKRKLTPVDAVRYAKKSVTTAVAENVIENVTGNWQHLEEI